MLRRILMSVVAATVASGIVGVAAVKRYEEVAERQRDRDEISNLRFLLDMERMRSDLLREKLRGAERPLYRQPPGTYVTEPADATFEAVRKDVVERIGGKK